MSKDNNFNLKDKIWWSYIDHDLRELLRESVLLADRVSDWQEKFHDYSFIVFPAAKAYEGFLKYLFLDMGFINEAVFRGKRFRIGKALNPSLDRRFRKKESVYDKIVTFCGGKDLADSLWDTWKSCRNLLFHWFPDEKNVIDYNQARDRVERVIETIDLSFRECKLNKS